MINIQTLDRKIWRKDLLLVYLHQCYNTNMDALIDLIPEGSCAEYLGLYRLLDEFCNLTGYKKSRITIKTTNLVEHHDEYVISKKVNYTIGTVQNWLKDKTLIVDYTPTKHFANFISRSNWFRLWIATILDTYHSDKTIQTYHYDLEKENYNANGYVGVDDLFRYRCDLIPEAVRFLQSCPRTIDLEFLKTADTTDSLFQHPNSYYPIQHPSNLNLLQYYNDIFVDIVVEPNISGNCFVVTEKLWRCILARRPFIVVSNVDFLKNLRKLGFKTFNKWWSEEYDMYGGKNRIKKIENLLATLARLTTKDLEHTLNEMEEVLEHNYKIFNALSESDIARNFYNG